MSIEMNKNNKKRFSIMDIIIIICSILAIIGLIVIIKNVKEKENEIQEELNNINKEIQNNEYDVIKDAFDYLIINEINQTGWIELYNISDENIDIKMLQVYINDEAVYKNEKELTISANSFFVIDLDKKITNKDVIRICDNNDSDIHFLVPDLDYKESYGTIEDGGIQYNYLESTKGLSNVGCAIVEKECLLFSVPGGFYSEDFTLEIYAPDKYKVYYTLDGTQPTIESSPYENPISIYNKSGSGYKYAQNEMNASYTPSSLPMGMVVRAILVDQNERIVEEKIESYYIGLRYASGFGDFPVVSIITDPKNLFDYFEGIYVKGRSYEDAIAMGDKTTEVGNYYNNWEKDAYIQYFESNKYKTFEGTSVISIVKDYSIATAQKSFNINADVSQLGSGFSSFLNEYTNSVRLETAGRDNYYKLREAIAGELLKDLNVGVMSYQPCNVFINGEYWGGYMLKQEYDQKYFEDNYNVKDKVIVVKNGIINDYDYYSLYNELYSFVIMNDMQDVANYSVLNDMMDIQSYIDYFCANMYMANADYGSEVMLWRTYDKVDDGFSDGKWRWLLGRMDLTMNNGMLGNLSTPSIDTMLQKYVTNDPFLQSLLRNEEFCDDLYHTMENMCNNLFVNERVFPVIDDVENKMIKYSTNSFKRFFGNVNNTFYSDEVNKIKTFFEERNDYIMIYTNELVEAGGDIDIIMNAREIMKAEGKYAEGDE